MSLTKRILLGMLLGILFGLVLNLFFQGAFNSINTFILNPLGKIFINLIRMLVIPIVTVSLILGTAGIGDPKKLGRIGIRTISFFIITTAIALIIAIGLGLLIQPGVGSFQLSAGEFKAQEAPPIMETLLNIIPTNPIRAMVEDNMLQIIVFSIFIGFGITKLGDRAKDLLKIIEQLNDILMYLVEAIMVVAPFGAFALIASAIGSQGLGAILAMGKYMVVVLLGLLLHMLLTYGTAAAILGKMNPIQFFSKFSPAMIVGFSTSSSSATLPVSMEVAQENLGIPKSISGFVQPLGATINMDGTAIMQGAATVFIAQVVGVDLSLSDLLTVVLTATLASIGTAGVPGVGLIMLTMVLRSVGLPVEAIGLILGVDRILDMCRTAVNITGDAVCALYISKAEETRS